VYDTVKVFCGCPNLDLVTLEKLGTYLYRLNIPQSVLDNITSFEVRIYQNGSWVTYQNVLDPGLQHLFVFIDEEAPYQFVFKNPCCEKTKRFVLGQLGRTVPEETEELQDPEARMVPAGNESSAELRIYPNPVSGMLNIQLPAASEPGRTEVQLFTFDGRQLFASGYSASFINLDMNAYPRGIYILRISSAAGVTSHRIVRE
ncbi:MAG: T9SS type A sorting domain-containing protein, partial [Bacteroidia bacterium]|nr:T9SS type A sorting domain-containing protein [Bacteroidia bacterium]